MFYDEETVMAMQEAKEKHFIDESSKIPDYYKNVLLEDYHNEFEQILKSIQDELILLHTNLVYTKKILDFINIEFKTEGVFPQDLAFLRLFITNTISSMILTMYKLVLDKENIQKKENAGLSYLKSLINTKNKNEKVIQNKLREVRPLIKKYKSLAKQGNIDVLRNGKIAHYDLGKQEELNKIYVDLDTLEKIYNVSVDIFEILSLKYFERISIMENKAIKYRSFKKFVCQSMMMSNPNPDAQLDLEGYFKHLRKNFFSSILNNQSNDMKLNIED